MAFDPNTQLRQTVAEAAGSGLSADLKKQLRHLGSQLFGWLYRSLEAERVCDPRGEAEEVFQQVCMKVFNRIRRLGCDVGVAWFWRVTKTTFLNYLQRTVKKRRKESSTDWDTTRDPAFRTLKEIVEGKQTVEQMEYWNAERIDALVRRSIAQLPPRHQEFFHLDLVERLPRDQLAEALDLAPKSLAALKAKAVKKLRGIILRELNDGPSAGLD